MKPLKMAAIRNNFVVVSLLLKAGADRIKEPSLERLADAKVETISEYLDIYRALASPAYLCLAHPNALSHAFAFTDRLRKIGRLWEAVNKEFYDLADQVEQFCASLLDHISNSNELTTLFRQSDNPEVIHAVAQVERAIDFQQKAFVAHAYTQKIMSINFYQGLDINSMMFPVLSLLTMFGYPVICLAYILVQHPRLKTFLSIPHIKLCIFFGSDLAFFTCCAIVCFIHDQRTLDIMVPIIAVFCLGLSWKHICEIMEFGIRDFLNYTMNIIEWAILIVLYIGLILSFTGDLTKVYIDRARLRHNERTAMVIGATMTSDLNPSNDTINGGLASLAWNDPNVIAYTLFAFVILLVVIHAFYTAIITFHDLYVVWESTLGAVGVIFKFMTIYVIFHFSCAVGLSRIYHPQILIGAEECSGLECELHEQRYRKFNLSLWCYPEAFILDSGAQVSLIKMSVAKEMNLKGSNINITITKVGGEQEQMETKQYQIKVRSLSTNAIHSLAAVALPCISENIAQVNMNEVSKQFNLKSEDLRRGSGSVHLLIGIDYPKMHLGETREKGQLAARKSPLGWVIFWCS
nr:transient-receptor-potential-like protein [Lytechinus pictus]